MGRVEEKPMTLLSMVPTACFFLQVILSKTGHQTSLCPAPTSPSTCGQTRSSSVRAHASDLPYWELAGNSGVCVYVCERLRTRLCMSVSVIPPYACCGL